MPSPGEVPDASSPPWREQVFVTLVKDHVVRPLTDERSPSPGTGMFTEQGARGVCAVVAEGMVPFAQRYRRPHGASLEITCGARREPEEARAGEETACSGGRARGVRRGLSYYHD